MAIKNRNFSINIKKCLFIEKEMWLLNKTRLPQTIAQVKAIRSIFKYEKSRSLIVLLLYLNKGNE